MVARRSLKGPLAVGKKRVRPGTVYESLKNSAATAGGAFARAGRAFTRKVTGLTQNAREGILEAEAALGTSSRAAQRSLVPTARKFVRRAQKARTNVERAARIIVQEAVRRAKALDPAQAARSAVQSALLAIEDAASKAARRVGSGGIRAKGPRVFSRRRKKL